MKPNQEQNRNDKRYALDLDKLNFDWARQRQQINERLSAEPQPNVKAVWKWGVAMASMIIISLSVLLWLAKPSGVVTEDDLTLYSWDEQVTETYVPDSLYVLNGFTGEQTNLDSTVDYVLAVEEEEL